MAKEVKPHPKLDELGKRIKLARKLRGLTQGQLADGAGVSQSAIAGYEKHGVPSGIPLAVVMHIAEEVGAPLSLLVYGDDEDEELQAIESAQSPTKARKAKRRFKKSAAKSGR